MRTYKYRLYPTRKQQETLQWTLDRTRELYNAALQERRDTWAIIKHHPNFYDEEWRKQAIKDHGMSCYGQINQLPEVKEVRDEYNDIYSQVLQETLKRVDKAYKAFFRRVQNGEKAGYPRYQGRDRYNSFCYPQSDFSLEGNRFVLYKDLSERVHTCENCGLVLDRDTNAAINILAVWNGLNLRPTPKTTKKKTQARTEPSEDAPLRSPWL